MIAIVILLSTRTLTSQSLAFIFGKSSILTCSIRISAAGYITISYTRPTDSIRPFAVVIFIHLPSCSAIRYTFSDHYKPVHEPGRELLQKWWSLCVLNGVP